MIWEILGLPRLENMLKSSDSLSGKYSQLRKPRKGVARQTFASTSKRTECHGVQAHSMCMGEIRGMTPAVPLAPQAEVKHKNRII